MYPIPTSNQCHVSCSWQAKIADFKSNAYLVYDATTPGSKVLCHIVVTMLFTLKVHEQKGLRNDYLAGCVTLG